MIIGGYEKYLLIPFLPVMLSSIGYLILKGDDQDKKIGIIFIILLVISAGIALFMHERGD